ncbi:MAG: YbaK/EbsC family protein, partial [Pseudomonadota bacterium]
MASSDKAGGLEMHPSSLSCCAQAQSRARPRKSCSIQAASSFLHVRLDPESDSCPMAAMPASPADLFAFLDKHAIAHMTVEHAATFTVEEGRHLKASLPGGHSKNLFMKDKDGTLVLISAWAESQLRLNQLHKLIGTRRLSFGSAEL